MLSIYFIIVTDLPAGHARLFLHEALALTNRCTSAPISSPTPEVSSLSTLDGPKTATISCDNIYPCAKDAKAAQDLLDSYSCTSPLEKNLQCVQDDIKAEEETLIKYKEHADQASEIERKLFLYGKSYI